MEKSHSAVCFGVDAYHRVVSSNRETFEKGVCSQSLHWQEAVERKHQTHHSIFSSSLLPSFSIIRPHVLLHISKQDQEARLEVLRERARQQRAIEAEALGVDALENVGEYAALQAPADAAIARRKASGESEGRAAASAIVSSWEHGDEEEGGEGRREAGDSSRKDGKNKKKAGFDAQVGWATHEHINFFKDIEEGQVRKGALATRSHLEKGQRELCLRFIGCAFSFPVRIDASPRPLLLKTKHGRNKDRDAEKKKEQEAWEKKVGILQYLGQTVYDRKGDKPWYEKLPSEANVSAKSFERHAVQKARQADLDPMKEMEVRAMRCRRGTGWSFFLSIFKYKPPPMQAVAKGRKIKDEKERQKETRRHRTYASHSRVDPSPRERYPPAAAADGQDALRQARLSREQVERDRVAALLASAVAGGPTPPATPAASAKRRSEYGTHVDGSHQRKKSKKDKYKKHKHRHEHHHVELPANNPYVSV